jgi:hypothetical protein
MDDRRMNGEEDLRAVHRHLGALGRWNGGR